MAIHLRRKRLKDGTQSLYLDCYQDGHRHREFLRFYLTGIKETDHVILQQAKIIHAKRQLEFSLNRYGMTTPVSFWDFANQFISTKNSGNQAIYHHMVGHLRKFPPASNLSRFEQLTPQFCTEFGEYLLTQPIKVGTAVLYYIKLRSICNAAIRAGHLTHNPCEPIHHKINDEPIRFLTVDEVNRLAQTYCKYPDVKHGFLFGCFTGLRLGDILSLEWTSISNGILSLVQEKTGRSVRIPLSTSANHILELHQNALSPSNNPSLKVFHYPSTRVMRKALYEWGQLAGLSLKLTHHMSRHTFAVMALNSGIDINTVRDLLGHTKMSTTLHYARLVDTTKQLAITKLPTLKEEPHG